MKKTATATLKELMTTYSNVTLRKLALSTKTTYGLLLKAARKPIEGQLYDPCATNYEAVEQFFERREINLNELEWEQMNIPNSHSREGAISKDISNYTVGSKWYLREDNSKSFEVIYTTETHIVIIQEGSTEPRSMSFSTFLSKGPMAEPRVED